MSATMSPLERAFTPLAAAVVAIAGALAGGAFYISLSGALLGLIGTLAILGILASVFDLLGLFPETSSAGSERAPASPSTAASFAATERSMAEIQSTLPPDAPIAPIKIEATETEAQYLNSGRFAEYHLAKAKRLFEAKNFKEAAYQASASLAHGDLPEAKALRKTALAAGK